MQQILTSPRPTGGGGGCIPSRQRSACIRTSGRAHLQHTTENQFLGYKYLNSLMRIRIRNPGLKNSVLGLGINIPDPQHCINPLKCSFWKISVKPQTSRMHLIFIRELYYVCGTLLLSATRPSKTHSMAVRAIP